VETRVFQQLALNTDKPLTCFEHYLALEDKPISHALASASRLNHAVVRKNRATASRVPLPPSCQRRLLALASVRAVCPPHAPFAALHRQHATNAKQPTTEGSI
jgi:hypothetical protein